MELNATDITLARRAFQLRATLSVAQETVAIVGRSGAGKSSLLKLVAGLERPSGGRVLLGDEVWFDAADGVNLRPEQRRVGYLPQDYALFPHLSVAGNVRFAARRDRPELLEALGVGHLRSARPDELSGGERQRVALARALARGPEVLLLDEPFAALDQVTRSQVRTELREILAGLQLRTLIVTHSFEDAAILADRIGVIETGQLLQLGSADELLRSPADATVAQLLGANVLAGVASDHTLELAGGGRIPLPHAAAGPIQVAIYPWKLRLTTAGQATLSEMVTATHLHEGSLIVTTERLRVRTPPEQAGLVLSGKLVGIDVKPEDVLVLAP